MPLKAKGCDGDRVLKHIRGSPKQLQSFRSIRQLTASTIATTPTTTDITDNTNTNNINNNNNNNNNEGITDSDPLAYFAMSFEPAHFVVQPPRTALVNSPIAPVVVSLDSRGFDLTAGVTPLMVNMMLIDSGGHPRSGLAGTISVTGAQAVTATRQQTHDSGGSSSSSGATSQDPFEVYFPFWDLSYHVPGEYKMIWQLYYFDGVTFHHLIEGESRKFKVVQTQEEMVSSHHSGNERRVLSLFA